MRLLAVDPGKMTGLAYIDTDAAQESLGRADALVVQELECWTAVAAIARGIEDKALDVLVVEAFNVGAETLKKGRGEMWSLKSIGALEWLAVHSRLDGPELVIQQPVEAKRFATDEKLRALGWWTRGKEHGRDATRHVLTFLAKRNELPEWVSAELRNMVV